MEKTIFDALEDLVKPVVCELKKAGIVGESADLIDADIVDKEDNIIVLVQIPGIPKENISVEIDDDKLTVKGERKETYEKYHSREIYYGKLEKEIYFPIKIDKNSVKAELKNGILEIEIKKTESATAKKVNIG